MVLKYEPYLINLASIGDSTLGYVSVAQSPEIPFIVKRVYWTYYTPNGVTRGHHAHKKLQQLICAVSGSIKFHFENKEGATFDFVLDNPSKAIYVPPGFWRTIELSHNAVLLCIASEEYDESDYIRNYEDFKRG